MPSNAELADLLAIPAGARFAPCAANHAITETFVSLARPWESAALWEVLREGFGRGWAAYFTAATGDRGPRIGLRAVGRRAEFVVATIHVTARGLKFSSSGVFGGARRHPILGPDRARSPALVAFLDALPRIRRTGVFFAEVYDHDQVLDAATELLPRHHPPL
jgi:hypothetical protein